MYLHHRPHRTTNERQRDPPTSVVQTRMLGLGSTLSLHKVRVWRGTALP